MNFQQHKYVDTIPKKEKAVRFLWGIVYVLFYRPTPRWLLHGWRRFLLRAFGAKIGRGSRISPSAKIWAPWNLSVGEFTAIADNVNCYTMDLIEIGSKVAISEGSFLCAGSHAIDTLRRPLITKPIRIGNHAWVAAECFVHPGVSIGEGAVIGARSVVVKDVPDWVVAVGNPCRVISARTIT